MKKIIRFFILTIFLFTSVSFSQTGWYVQNVSSTNHLHSIYFPSASTGYIAGWASEFIKTTDGGNNWFHLNCITIDAQSTFFINNDVGWISGGAGVIGYTTNGGNSWVNQVSGFTGHLYSIVFINTTTGWVVGDGGKILKSTNSGINWSTVSSGTTYNLTSICFINSNTGWITGDHGIIFKTINSGDNWFTQNPGVTNNVGKAFFVNETTGWVTGDVGIILKTTTGGNSWILQQSGTSNWIMTSYFVSASTGWIAGVSGIILKTTNGGDNWFTQTSNTSNDFRCNYFLNSLTGFTVGFNGTVVKTTNGGIAAPATPVLISPANNSVDISLTPTLTWGAVGGADNYTVQISTTPNFLVYNDSITTTNIQYTVPSGKLQEGYTYFWRVKASNSIGSSSWSSVWNFATHIGPEAPTLVSPLNGATGIILTPTLDWNDVPAATGYLVEISPNSSFSIITDSATVTVSQRTVPAGKLLANNIYYWRVCAMNSTTSGPWSVVWNFYTVTTPPVPNLVSPANFALNQPRTPTLIWDSLATATFYKVQISTVSNFIVIVDSATVSNHQYIVPLGKLFDNITYFWRVYAGNQYGTSSWSVVWRFTVNPVGLSYNGNSIPDDFKLYTNYPNPFNPATKVKFDIPKSTPAKLIVYDALGRTVETLVNKELPAGTYEYTWNASKYNSGIYFIRFVSDKYTETKRMVLLK